MINRDKPRSEDIGLPVHLERVLGLQPRWTRLSSPDMEERGTLIRDTIPQALRTLLARDSDLKSQGFEVQGRDGIGLKIRIPWIRIYVPEHSPNARAGWYAAYLFAFDGSSAYLSLNQGTTAFRQGVSGRKREQTIQDRAAEARALLGISPQTEDGPSQVMDLKDPGKLGRGYQLGNVYSKPYLRGNIPPEPILASHLAQVLKLLLKLYQGEGQEVVNSNRPYWFVGAHWGQAGDQTDRFVRDGVWENGNKTRYHDEVKSIEPGDHIAIKAAYTRKKNLPFDNRGHTVGTMAIKATGTVIENLGDGRTLKVKWTMCLPPREWYFFTNLYTVWKVQPDNWCKQGLVDFAFHGQSQDLFRFRNDPFWRERFGDTPEGRYTVDDILTDGCFLERIELETMLSRLHAKKNLILQGPPGTGKTWLAKRLAFAFIGTRDESKVKVVQFHPNLSYEDFVRGLRPDSDGRFSIVDGPFMEMINSASSEPASPHVVVIEEINRGNPAQILGEMLTLLEADRRTPAHALELCHRKHDGERVFLPENLYVIGTMNVADRSLALVDFALRRRFAFVDLEPRLGERWRDWVSVQSGIDPTILVEVERRVIALNDRISQDPSLGPQFRIGHSFVTPAPHAELDDGYEWFKQIVMTDIGPLLEEYWFDSPAEAREARRRLVEGL